MQAKKPSTVCEEIFIKKRYIVIISNSGMAKNKHKQPLLTSLHMAPQPIPYQGSKRKIAHNILKYFPTHISRIVEPFAGSAAISVASAMYGKSTHFWLNDGHIALMDLWHEIIYNPSSISTEYEKLWNKQHNDPQEYFKLIRKRFNEKQKPADFLYILARCVKAAIRYNQNGNFNNSPDNRRRGARPIIMRERISTVSSLLQSNTKITAFDYRKVLDNCKSNDLIYMDPPYQGTCTNHDHRYLPLFEHAEFYDELAKLVDRDIMFAVSYDGRSGQKKYGRMLPKSLNLRRIEINAGRSTQATLLGRSYTTYESLYISPALLQACI